MFTLFLAKRFFRPKFSDDESKNHRGASVPAIRIATAGIAVGLAVMLITVCVVKGFQREVSNKIIGFASHLELVDERSFASAESYPLVTDADVVNVVKKAPGVVHVQRISEKMGIFKTENDFAGMCLKGVSAKDYDLMFLRSCVTKGKLPDFSDERSSNSIVISQQQADKLHLGIGDKVYCYFFERTIKQRVFKVAAIYNTNMHQYDKTFVLTDLFTVNRLNSWDADQSSGLEVRLSSMDQVLPTHLWLKQAFQGKKDRNGNAYSVINVYENPRSASVLSWLRLLDFNIIVILVIMICVAGFTMVSGLLILILERTSTIGVLKALGASNSRIRHTFLWYAAFIISRGMLFGNAIGLGIIALQAKFHFVHLDPSSYYVDAAPVEVNWLWIAGINAVTLMLTMLALIIPSYLASSVQPAKAIQFD